LGERNFRPTDTLGVAVSAEHLVGDVRDDEGIASGSQRDEQQVVVTRSGCVNKRRVDEQFSCHVVSGIVARGLGILLQLFSRLNDDGGSDSSDEDERDEHDHGANADGCKLVVVFFSAIGLQMTTAPAVTSPP
jgi:hypothetical protein